MSGKADLFFKAMQAKRGGSKPQRFAEGGPVEASGVDVAPPEAGSDVAPEEVFAASEIQSAISDTGPGGPERLAKALKAFWLIVDAQPHTEGGTDEMDDAGGFPG